MQRTLKHKPIEFRTSLWAWPKALALLATLLVIFTTTVACHPQPNQDEEGDKALREIYRELNEKKYDDAIAALKSRSQEKPEDEETTVLMASAYAGRAGVSTLQFLDLAKLWVNDRPQARTGKGTLHIFTSASETQIFADPSSVGQEKLPQKSDQLLYQILRGLDFYLRAKEKFDAVPNVVGAARSDLDQAVALLDQIKEPKPGHALYRAILRSVILKARLQQGEIWRITRKSLAPGGGCLVTFDQISHALNLTFDEVELLVGDFDLALKRQHGEFALAKASILDARANLTSVLSPSADDKLNLVDAAKAINWLRDELGWNWACQ